MRCSGGISLLLSDSHCLLAKSRPSEWWVHTKDQYELQRYGHVVLFLQVRTSTAGMTRVRSTHTVSPDDGQNIRNVLIASVDVWLSKRYRSKNPQTVVNPDPCTQSMHEPPHGAALKHSTDTFQHSASKLNQRIPRNPFRNVEAQPTSVAASAISLGYRAVDMWSTFLVH